MADGTALNPAAPLQFVINAAAGSNDAETKRALIEAALHAGGRRAQLSFSSPAELPRIARDAVARALSTGAAVVAVGGDGTLNTVAQAAHAAGCAIGIVPQGTFNYFARSHGIAVDPTQAVHQLLGAAPQPVQVAGINDRIFLVNASLGLYPELLENREAYKARFGRSRWVALWAASVTLLRAQQHLRLHIEQGASVRDLRALTLFVGNNRLQLEQFGLQAPPAPAGASPGVSVTAVMVRPIGTVSMLGLMLRGAMGNLGDAESVEHFEFEHLVVRPRLPLGRRRVKVAFDGEVAMMRSPLDFRVLHKPLYLLKPVPDAGTGTDASGFGTRVA